jgi:RluA family pseudouridine synthase
MNKQIPEVFSNEHILAVSKPAGIVVIPERYSPNGEDLRSLLEKSYGKLFVVHRIDRETSGVVVFAKNPEAHRLLNAQFSGRSVKKIYHAIVSPCPRWEETIADMPLSTDTGPDHLTAIDRKYGKTSITRFRLLKSMVKFALVEASPETGRTHQIRVHAQSLGIPVVADNLYGDGKPLLLSSFKRRYKGDLETERPLMNRLALHAYSITFTNPQDNAEICVKADYPRDFSAAVKQLSRIFVHNTGDDLA